MLQVNTHYLLTNLGKLFPGITQLFELFQLINCFDIFYLANLFFSTRVLYFYSDVCRDIYGRA